VAALHSSPLTGLDKRRPETYVMDSDMMFSFLGQKGAVADAQPPFFLPIDDP
jgi:hypothetical protein